MHTNHDVASTIELPVDVHLGEGGPLRELLHATPQLLIFQDVDRLEGYIQCLEYLHSMRYSCPAQNMISQRQAGVERKA